MLTYALKNVDFPNDLIVSKRDVESFSSQYVLMVTLKIHAFDASLFEETSNRSNSEIWASFFSWMFSPTL